MRSATALQCAPKRICIVSLIKELDFPRRGEYSENITSDRNSFICHIIIATALLVVCNERRRHCELAAFGFGFKTPRTKKVETESRILIRTDLAGLT